jgi:hypothetical protein
MTTHPPVEIASYRCGCRVYGHNIDGPGAAVYAGSGAGITYCPTHVQAPVMLAALRAMVTRYDELTAKSTRIQFQNEVEQARALLRAVEG